MTDTTDVTEQAGQDTNFVAWNSIPEFFTGHAHFGLQVFPDFEKTIFEVRVSLTRTADHTIAKVLCKSYLAKDLSNLVSVPTNVPVGSGEYYLLDTNKNKYLHMRISDIVMDADPVLISQTDGNVPIIQFHFTGLIVA